MCGKPESIDLGKLSDDLVEAFPSASAFEEAVHYKTGENISALAGPSNTLPDIVRDVVNWAAQEGRLDELVQAAYEVNTNNPALDALLSQRRVEFRDEPGSENVPPILNPQLRRALVQALLAMPITESYDGRSQLLMGMPWAANLPRNVDDPEADLDKIVIKVSSYSRLPSGTWPLMLLVDNAVAYSEDPQTEKRLRKVRTKLAHLYGEEAPKWKY